jgi:hypothetical protein
VIFISCSKFLLVCKGEESETHHFIRIFGENFSLL